MTWRSQLAWSHSISQECLVINCECHKIKWTLRWGDVGQRRFRIESTNRAVRTALPCGDCMTTAADHEATMAARTEELKVIATAEQILKDSTSGAVGQSYSLLQLSSKSASKLQSRADLANSEVIGMVKRLARDHHSAALAQLASPCSCGEIWQP